MIQRKKRNSRNEPSVAGMVEAVIGCKWSLTVLDLVAQGINRPGAMARTVDGLSAKVLNERLRKLCRFGVLAKTSYPEVPPRVEYALTEFGTNFLDILDRIRALEASRSEPSAGQRKGSGRDYAA